MKDNQPSLGERLVEYPWSDRRADHVEHDRGHGRIEKRSLRVFQVPADAPLQGAKVATLRGLVRDVRDVPDVASAVAMLPFKIRPLRGKTDAEGRCHLPLLEAGPAPSLFSQGLRAQARCKKAAPRPVHSTFPSQGAADTLHGFGSWNRGLKTAGRVLVMTDIPQLETVRSEVQRLASGRRTLRFWQVAGQVVFWLLVVVAVLAFFLKWKGTLIAGGVAVVVGTVVAALAAALTKVDTVAVAKRYDDKVGTRDLLSSSLQLGRERGSDATQAAFVAAVQEDAANATGRAQARDLYPAQMPREARWIPAPLLAAALAIAIPLLLAPKPPELSAADLAIRAFAAQQLENLLEKAQKDALTAADQKKLEAIKNLSERLKDQDSSKKDLLAELAKLQSQLDKDKEQLGGKKLEIEKNAAKLAAGEDAKDAKKDMDAGRFREAANKVKKKAEELQKQLEEELKKSPPDQAKIEQLKKRLGQLKELLADLEQLDALGKGMGFLLEAQEVLEQLEGQLGKMKDFEGDTWDEAELGQRPQQGQKGPPQKGDKLLVYPSNESGEGHVEKFKSEKGSRSLTEREEKETALRESKKGKSRFGQVKTANDGSKSRSEFADTALAAKRAAEDVIHRQNIPAGYRSYIRRYFELMQPDDKPGVEDEKKEGK